MSRFASLPAGPLGLSLLVLLLAPTRAPAVLGMETGPESGSPVAPAAPRVRSSYAMKLRAGGSQIAVRCRFRGSFRGKPRLGLLRTASPGIRSTREAYALDGTLVVRLVSRSGRRAVSASWLDSGAGGDHDMRGLDILEVAEAPGKDEVLEVQYRLDLSRAAEDPAEEKDRVALTRDHALLRGDVLLHVRDAVTTRARTRFCLPRGWRQVGTFPEAMASAGPGTSGLAATEWVVLVHGPGAAATATGRIGELEYRVAAVGEGREKAPALLAARLRDHATRFGTDSLGYLPSAEDGRPVITVLARSATGNGREIGGQYLAASGTAFFLFRSEDPAGLGHLASHEIFHAWNDTGLVGGAVPAWWMEGFTDLVAMVQNARLRGSDPASRRRALLDELARTGRQLLEGGDLDGSSGFVLATASPEAAPEDAAAARRYDQLAYQLPVLYLARLAALMPAGGVDAWFRRVLERHGSHVEDAVSPGYPELKAAALEVSGGSRAAVEAFFRERFERPATLTRAELRQWLRDPAVGALVR